MAILRVFAHRSGIVASLRPGIIAARVGRQIYKESISTGARGSSGPLANGNFFIATTRLDLKPRQWRYLGLKGRKMGTSNSTFCVRAGEWKGDYTPYETLEVTRDAEEDDIKSSYRRLAKQFHPDVYNNSTGGLRDGESPEAKFIKIQAAYELLMHKGQRRQYDMDHRINPMHASRAWMDWVMKKKKAFEQRGDMAASVWAEQQQREMTLKARHRAKHKMDPEEERRLLAKERTAMTKNFETTLTRHTLVLKKRELLWRKDAEEAKKKLVRELLAAEGLELDDEKYS